MAVRYNRLWKMLIDLKMKKTALQKAAGVSANVMARLSKDAYVSLESLEKICSALNCSLDDVLEFIPAHEGEGLHVERAQNSGGN